MILGLYVVNSKPRNKQDPDLSKFFEVTENLLKPGFHCTTLHLDTRGHDERRSEIYNSTTTMQYAHTTKQLYYTFYLHIFFYHLCFVAFIVRN